MARVTVEDCVDKVPNRFDLVLLAAQRARQISGGADLTIDRDRDKNPVVALREIAEETVKPQGAPGSDRHQPAEGSDRRRRRDRRAGVAERSRRGAAPDRRRSAASDPVGRRLRIILARLTCGPALQLAHGSLFVRRRNVLRDAPTARCSGRAQQALLVADLHLEKASWFARLGQFLPPYDSHATLTALADARSSGPARRGSTASATASTTASAATGCRPSARELLTELTARLDWTWIVGNHDPGFADHCGGTLADEVELGGIILRHEAVRGEPRPEMSGHFTPSCGCTCSGRQRLAPLLRRVADQADPAGVRLADRRPRRPSSRDHAVSVGADAAALVPVSDRLLRFPLAA